MHEVEKLDISQQQTTELRINHWICCEVFSYQWWILLAITFLSWLIWAKLSDKNRIMELLLFGVILSYIATVLDATGTELHIWSYTYKLVPLYNRLLPIDAALLPTTYMLVYQWFPKWKQYLIAHCVVSLGAAFVAEALLTWMHIYNPHYWKHLYSAPIYFVLAIFMKWMLERLKNLQRKYKP